MFTSITHILTLAAFAVHAVLGCCWHHEQRTSDGSCQHHGHAAHSLPSGQDLSPRDGASVDEIHTVDFADACYCAASGEHPHDCDGTHCTYVRSGSASTSPATTQPLNWLAQLDNRWGQSAEAESPAGNRGHVPAAVPLCTAAQACAVLQIWQI